jgi:hypothetical protein
VLLEQDDDALEALTPEIAEGDLPPAERLAIYRNNVFVSLTEALKETFPAVCRLVDERFFSYAAHEFIAAHPPMRPALIEYGAAFPLFLANFPPCRELTYLPDVARFEWLMNVAAHASDAEAISPDGLTTIPPADAPRIMFTLHPSYSYIESEFPIDRIWRANRQGACGEAEIDLTGGGVYLEVSRQGGDVVFRHLAESTFAFRQALAGGNPLGQALARAFAIEVNFAAQESLAALFGEQAITAVRLMEQTA